MTSRTTERPTIPTRVATVAAVDDVVDGLRQITFGGLHLSLIHISEPTRPY